MCSVKTWSTKEDVLKDLVKTSGRRIARMGDLDRGFVIGDAPPPIVSEIDDEELRLQFGDDIDTRRDISTENQPPDLQGIQNLIRMVQLSDEEDDEDTTPIEEQSKCFISIRKPTKLNPNVKEFIPKSALSSHSSSDISESTSDCKTKNTKCNGNIKDNAENITPNYVEDLPIVEDFPIVEDITTKLKSTITSKPDSFEKKKQNNVAIASLLRLHSKQTPPELKECIKLITPEYYESPNRPESAQPTLEVISPQTTTSTLDSKSVLSINPSCSSNDVRSEPALPTQEMIKSPITTKVDPAIKKSIEKVNSWFGEPSERKSPAICLGPIAFKRKEPAAQKSPSKSETDTTKASKPELKQFKPSGYAADLEKKYMERSKANKKQNKNMWTDLEAILKEKDEILSKKQLEQARQNSDDPGPSRQ